MTIILFHGLLCNFKVWGELNQLRKYFNVIDADLVNYDSIPEMANSVISKLNPDKEYTLIGISMGGYVVLDILLRNIAWVKKAVLINTSSAKITPDSINLRKDLIKLAKQQGVSEILKLYPNSSFYNNTEQLVKLRYEMAQDVGLEAYIRQQTAIMTKPIHNKLEQIEAETLIITSQDDKVIPCYNSFEIHNKMQRSKLIFLKKCGHLLTLEKGLEVYKAIKLFIE